MTIISWLKQAVEYLAGEQDEPPVRFPIALGNFWFWTVWWSVFVFLIYVFSGQSSRFIYIDF